MSENLPPARPRFRSQATVQQGATSSEAAPAGPCRGHDPLRPPLDGAEASVDLRQDDDGADVQGENSVGYGAQPTQAELLRDVRSEFEPQGVIEETWCRDIALLIMDAARLRRIRETYLPLAKRRVSDQIIEKAVQSDRDVHSALKADVANDLRSALIHGDEPYPFKPEDEEYDPHHGPSHYVRAKDTLIYAGYSDDGLEAEAYMQMLFAFDKIEKLIVITESRRDIVIGKLDRRREERRSTI